MPDARPDIAILKARFKKSFIGLEMFSTQRIYLMFTSLHAPSHYENTPMQICRKFHL